MTDPYKLSGILRSWLVKVWVQWWPCQAVACRMWWVANGWSTSPVSCNVQLGQMERYGEMAVGPKIPGTPKNTGLAEGMDLVWRCHWSNKWYLYRYGEHWWAQVVSILYVSCFGWSMEVCEIKVRRESMDRFKVGVVVHWWMLWEC